MHLYACLIFLGSLSRLEGKLFNEPGGACYEQDVSKTTSKDHGLSLSETLVCQLTDANFTENQKLYIQKLGTIARSGILPKVVRKEIRTLSKNDRQALFEAINQLRENEIDGVTEIDLFVKLHGRGVAPSATRLGASTWGWHREYLLRFETALRLHNKGVALAYWDPRLERHLPDNCQSILWSSKLFGNDYGVIKEGPFEKWPLSSNCLEALNSFIIGSLYVSRACTTINGGTTKNQDYNGFGFSDYDVEKMLNAKTFSEFANLECVVTDHDIWHRLVGGTQLGLVDAPSCAVSDPIFWMGHAFLDMIWDSWRRSHGNSNLTTDFPSTNYSCLGVDSYLYPFQPMKNVDAFSEDYEKRYSYESSPFYCQENSDCRSAFLWCEKANSRCVSKVRGRGNCRGLSSEACHMSAKCSDGICSNANVRPPIH